MDEAMNKAFAAALADKVLEALDGPQRDGILAKGVKSALEGWELKTACAKLIEDRAKAKAAESGVFDAEIAAAVRAALDKIVAKVEGVAKRCFITALFGTPSKDGYGGSSGLILKHFD